MQKQTEKSKTPQCLQPHFSDPAVFLKTNYVQVHPILSLVGRQYEHGACKNCVMRCWLAVVVRTTMETTTIEQQFHCILAVFNESRLKAMFSRHFFLLSKQT